MHLSRGAVISDRKYHTWPKNKRRCQGPQGGPGYLVISDAVLDARVGDKSFVPPLTSTSANVRKQTKLGDFSRS